MLDIKDFETELEDKSQEYITALEKKLELDVTYLKRIRNSSNDTIYTTNEKPINIGDITFIDFESMRVIDGWYDCGKLGINGIRTKQIIKTAGLISHDYITLCYRTKHFSNLKFTRYATLTNTSEGRASTGLSLVKVGSRHVLIPSSSVFGKIDYERVFRNYIMLGDDLCIFDQRNMLSTLMMDVTNFDICNHFKCNIEYVHGQRRITSMNVDFTFSIFEYTTRLTFPKCHKKCVYQIGEVCVDRYFKLERCVNTPEITCRRCYRLIDKNTNWVVELILDSFETILHFIINVILKIILDIINQLLKLILRTITYFDDAYRCTEFIALTIIMYLYYTKFIKTLIIGLILIFVIGIKRSDHERGFLSILEESLKDTEIKLDLNI